MGTVSFPGPPPFPPGGANRTKPPGMKDAFECKGSEIQRKRENHRFHRDRPRSKNICLESGNRIRGLSEANPSVVLLTVKILFFSFRENPKNPIRSLSYVEMETWPTGPETVPWGSRTLQFFPPRGSLPVYCDLRFEFYTGFYPKRQSWAGSFDV